MMPRVATMAAQGKAWKEPMRIDALTDEAVQQGQTDAAHGHDHEDGGVDRHRLRKPAEIRDHAGVPALVDDADREEEPAGGQPVVDHLEHTALDAPTD